MKNLVRDIAEYESLYQSDKSAQWGIDASTDYLSCSTSPDLIYEYAKHVPVKLICILRDPMDRAFSEYRHTIRAGYQNCTFSESLQYEGERIQAGWIPLFHHVRRSRYAHSLEIYMELFGSDDFLLIPFEAFNNKSKLLATVERFLGVKHYSYANLSKENAPSDARFSWLKNLIEKPGFSKSIAKHILPDSIRKKVKAANEVRSTMKHQDEKRLYSILKEDIELCRSLIPFSIKHWSR